MTRQDGEGVSLAMEMEASMHRTGPENGTESKGDAPKGEKATRGDQGNEKKVAGPKSVARSDHISSTTKDSKERRDESASRKNGEQEVSANKPRHLEVLNDAEKSKSPISTKKSGTKEPSDTAATTLGSKPATTLGIKTTIGAKPKTTLGGTTTIGVKPVTTLGGTASMGTKPKLPTSVGLKSTAGAKTPPTSSTDVQVASSSASNPLDRPAQPGTSPTKHTDIKQDATKTKMTALAAKLRKQREERERLEQERIEMEKEAERLALEAEKKRIEEENRIKEAKKAKQNERRAQNIKLEAEKKKEQLIMQRKLLLSKFQGAYVEAMQKDEDKKMGEKKRNATQKKKKKDRTEEKKRESKKQEETKPTEDLRPCLYQLKVEDDDRRQHEESKFDESEPVVQESWEDEFEEESENPSNDSAPTCPSELMMSETEPKEPKKPASEDNNQPIKENADSKTSENTIVPSDKAEPPLRSPICCVLGHVDTGKTKLLDKIRHTDVQTGEVGGITQQIGATYFPMESIQSLTSGLIKPNVKIDVPALLIIDTPGHASFSNLRHRGSSLCDIAILVIDILHGVEAMTVESIKLLRSKKTPFVVALNKIDRLYRWRAFQNKNIQYSLKMQEKTVLQEFEDKVSVIIQQLAQYSLNAELYYKVKNMKSLAKTVSLVPTSAHTGEGIPDLIYLLVQLTQRLMKSKLQLTSEFQCTILEVKVSEGIGPNIDVILVSGSIHEGDRFVTCGFGGPIVSTVRAILTPPPMRELRVHNHYTHNKVVHASQGFKIMANGLERAVAGSPLFVFKNESELPDLVKIVMKPLEALLEKIQKASHGVYVQASTLGSLEALLDFLSQSCKIPIADFGIGPVHTRDVKLASIMLEKAPEYACILAFDVDISPSAQELAETLKVKIFHADVIYQLEEQFQKYISDYRESRRAKSISEAIFPCFLKVKPDAVFNNRSPIVIGVSVKQGILKKGTPIVVWSESKEEWLNLGNIVGIERDNKPIEQAVAGEETCISIKAETGQQYLFGRHLDEDSDLYSKITRASLDALKLHYPDVVKQNLIFLKQLKKLFEIEKSIPPPT